MIEGRLRWALRMASGWQPHRGRNVVLSYHRIAAAPAPDKLNMVVEAGRFRRQITAVSRRYAMIRACDALTRGEEVGVAVTFDDGYADNAKVAAPILREFGIPATFFVTTEGLHDDGEFWWDRLEHLFLDPGPLPPRDTVEIDERTIELHLGGPHERFESFGLVVRALRRCAPTVALSVTDRLARQFGVTATPCERHRRMSADMACALAAEPLFEIGSHTCSHAALRALDRAGCRRELTESRDTLGRLLGSPPGLLAYPYGAPPSMGRRDIREAARAGYTLAFVNTPGSADRSHRFAVHRIGVVNCEPEALLDEINRWASPQD